MRLATLYRCNIVTHAHSIPYAARGDTMYRVRQMQPRQRHWRELNLRWLTVSPSCLSESSNRSILEPTANTARHRLLCARTGLMAEFVAENCGVSSANGGGKSAHPGDEAGGGDGCEVSVSNGDCGTCGTDNPGLETAMQSVVLDGKTGIPRKTSIIKVNDTRLMIFKGFKCWFCVKPRPDTHTRDWVATSTGSRGFVNARKSKPTVDMSWLFRPNHVFLMSFLLSWFTLQRNEVTYTVYSMSVLTTVKHQPFQACLVQRYLHIGLKLIATMLPNAYNMRELLVI